MSTREVLQSPGVPFVLYLFGHTMLLALAYTAVSPVFLFTDIDKGGFQFNPQWISYFLAVAGGSQALWMLLVFPPLQKAIGTGGLLRLCAFVWPFMMASYPILNEFLRNGWTTAFWIVGPISLVIGSGVSMAFGKPISCLNRILLTHYSLRPTLRQRYFALIDSPRHRQRLVPDSQQCCTSRDSCPVHQHIRLGCQTSMGRWTSDLVHPRRDCVIVECCRL